jgi:SAM-dependent methyltransferase
MSPDHQTQPAPSPWITRFSGLVHGPMLDVACGSGRHTGYFAERGQNVTALDRDLSRLGTLRDHPRVHAIEADLESDDAPWRHEPSAYGGIIVTNYLYRPLLPSLVAALQPGGVLIYETFGAGNEAFGKPSNPDFLLRPGELLDAVRGTLTVVAYEHGKVTQPRPAIVQRICAIQANPSLASSLPLDSSA